MITETMTVHEALSHLKTLDARITKEIDRAHFTLARKVCESKINGTPLAEEMDKIKSHYNSVVDMLARRAAIRNALSQSNAQTKVTIAGREYTMAEAIEMRKTGVKLKQHFVDVMMKEYEGFEGRVQAWNNETLTSLADTYISKMYGARESIDAQTVEAARAAYVDANKMEIVDPMDVRKKAEVLQNEIDQFVSEVDSKISVSNAITQLTVTY